MKVVVIEPCEPRTLLASPLTFTVTNANNAGAGSLRQAISLANSDLNDPGEADTIRPLHYAFLITEEEFDTIFGRIVERSIDHYADPAGRRRGEINHNDGGRGVYFPDPNGHWLEIITRPSGSG